VHPHLQLVLLLDVLCALILAGMATVAYLDVQVDRVTALDHDVRVRVPDHAEPQHVSELVGGRTPARIRQALDTAA
jgi:hypothetical protein